MNDKEYFRRCHICGHVNHGTHESVDSCGNCGLKMAPFFYFSELEQTNLNVDGSPDDLHQEIDVSNQYQPLKGLSSYW